MGAMVNQESAGEARCAAVREREITEVGRKEPGETWESKD